MLQIGNNLPQIATNLLNFVLYFKLEHTICQAAQDKKPYKQLEWTYTEGRKTGG